ncbi:MAG: FMN-binding protein [Elusimicrobiales bacterium]|nr:FMN-binding protein [Elusimicrobiales bacterium]
MRKLVIAAAVLTLAGAFSPARAERLLTDEKAIAEMLPGAESVEKVARPVSAEELAAIKAQLGGFLSVDAKAAADPKEFIFHFGLKGGKRAGAALLDSQPGKWGVVGFAVGLDAANGKIVNMAVTTLSEKRGRPVALKSFLKQFFGKGKTDKFETGKDVNAIAGATVSTKAAAFAARKAVVVYSVLFPKH